MRANIRLELSSIDAFIGSLRIQLVNIEMREDILV